MTIERLTPDADVEPIVQIERASFSTPWTADMFRWELRNSEVSSTWVARADDGSVMAFCCVWVVLDELHINNIAVAPEFRRSGTAAGLLEHVMSDAVQQGATRATLEVRRSNRAALKLYERLGFSEGGVRPNYYTNPAEDALILWRSLDVPHPVSAHPAR
ncbi:MAG: ribosomal protein S18-alanine N-acetyltransferase [Bacteroidales bacterium]